MATQKLCDLHAHSTFSDGTYTPTEIINAAQDIGLSAVALTDHSSINGLPELIDAASRSHVLPACGCEFSTDYKGIELHLVGLFISTKAFDDVTSLLAEFESLKIKSNIDLIEALQAGGYDITLEDVKKVAEHRINRPHIATVLMNKGYVSSVREAFDRLLQPHHGFYKPCKHMDVLEMISFVRGIGAVPILAHPLLNLDETELRMLLPRAKDAGLCAIETNYSTFSPAQTALLCEIADTYGLKRSGGSDFHGNNKPDIALGTGRGNLAVPFDYFLELQELAR